MIFQDLTPYSSGYAYFPWQVGIRARRTYAGSGKRWKKELKRRVTLNGTKDIIFFAYQGRSKENADENVDAILKAIKTYNQYQSTFEAKSWEDYKKTTVINKEVLEAIDRCTIFACDVSYFNHNVLFELGYAIGKDKKILILLNKDINNATATYNEFLLKSVRYTSFNNAKDITTALRNKNYEDGLLNKYVNIANVSEGSNDLFYIQSAIKNEPSIELTESIDELRKERNFSLITDDSSEVEYKPTEWYFQNIVKSKHAIIHLLGQGLTDAFKINAKNSFFAGLALGLNRKVILAAPAKFKAPLDYHDIIVQYSSAENLVNTVIDLLSKNLPVIEKPKLEEKEIHELNLIKLGVGCEVAEQEKEELLKYFIETAAYFAALRQNKSVIVGRKGAGKSAIYIKTLNELENDKRHYIVSLRPESDDLLEDVELSDLYHSPSAKITFFTTVWKLVIFSKLSQIIYERIMEKEAHSSYSMAEDDLINFVEQNELLLKMNVFGVVREISNRLRKGSIDSPQVLEDLYKHFLNPMVGIVKDYFKSINAKYYKIIILADNLDKTWDAEHDLDIQTDLILSLLEIEEKIKKMLSDSKDEQVDVKDVIFLRKDIFEYVLKIVSEPDKLMTMAHEINWEDYPELLRKVIEDRFMHILNLKNSAEVEKAWSDFFEFKDRKHPFDVIAEIITRRPRDIIYFVSRLFESAVNKGHKKVTDEDLKFAIENYTKFLNGNLVAELKAEFPEISDILTQLQQHHGEILEYKKLDQILDSVGYAQDRKESLVKNLFEKGYMLGFDDKTRKPFSDIKTLQEKLRERRYWIIPKKVFVIAHAKYYFIKNKKSPF